MRTLIILVLCVQTFIGKSEITVSDSILLTKNLIILSSEWDDASVQICNEILEKDEYSTEDWSLYFNNYFTHFPLTDHLRNYLGYPIFLWLNIQTHQKLQHALAPICLEQLDSLYQLPNLGQTLGTSTPLRQDIFNFSFLLDDIVFSDNTTFSASDREQIDASIVSMVGKSRWLKRNLNISAVTYPYVAPAALVLHSILLHLRPLNDSRLSFIGSLLQLPQVYKKVLSEHQVLLADNNSMSAADITFVEKLLSSVPAEIHDLHLLSNNDYNYASGQQIVNISLHLPAVNVFSTVGGYIENGFASDVPSWFVDGFALVAAHELNHRVDPDYIYKNENYASRREQLLDQAAGNDLNFLRSTVGSDYFLQNPQEFFPSIANIYLANTERTLDLALSRWNKGYKEL
jgi:hypothetical protein